MDGWMVTDLIKMCMENKGRGLCFVQRSSSGCWALVGQNQSGEAHEEGVVVGISCEEPD